MTRRWLVTGAGGQLGTDLVRALDGAQVTAFSHAELDIADPDAVRRTVLSAHPDIVLNAAAYTAVDAAESDVDQAGAVNAEAPGVLAAVCAELGARMVHVSTDYVFAGDATRPYEPADPVGPRSVYGRTKLAGEDAVRAALVEHYVVRTAWVYGDTGGNFVKTIAGLERRHEKLKVVDDQRGSPTWSADLARGLVELAGSAAPYGTYHVAGGGETTWYGFARAVFAELGADPARVLPCTTDEYPRPAPRPAYSVLSATAWQAAGLTPLRHWRDALGAAFAAHGTALRGS